jgi:hypothetical protein
MCLKSTAMPRAFFTIITTLPQNSSKQRRLVFSGHMNQLSGGTVKVRGRDLLALNQGVACFAKHSVLSSFKQFGSST